jgi:hypothetical protein
MKFKKYTFVLLMAGVLLFSCEASRVSVDADPQVNLNRYHTFRFTDNDNSQSASNPLYSSSILENAIHARIAMELEKRGVREDIGNPDLLMAYHTFTEKKQSSVNNYYPMMYGGWAWRFYPWGFSPYPFGYWNGYNNTTEYTEGTLIIDAIDAKSNQVVWRGSVSEAIDDPDNIHKKATKAVELIFKKFPIKPQGNMSNDSEKPLASKKDQ